MGIRIGLVSARGSNAFEIDFSQDKFSLSKQLLTKTEHHEKITYPFFCFTFLRADADGAGKTQGDLFGVLQGPEHFAILRDYKYGRYRNRPQGIHVPGFSC